MKTTPLARIMLVEDEPDIRAIACLALEKIGRFTVQACASGSEALSAAADFAPDLILLDVMMPTMDGPGTLKALRTLPQMAAVPVVFLTAKVQPHEIEHYKKLGAIEVIPKPFDPLTLSSNVSTVWDTHQQQPPGGDGQFQELYDAYAQQLPGRLRDFRQHYAALQNGPDWADRLKTLHRLAHNLVGSCATFGFDSLGSDSRALESLLKSILNSTLPPCSAQTRQIGLLLDGLEKTAGSVLSAEPSLPPISLPQPAAPHAGPAPANPDHRLIFLVESNPDLTRHLTVQLGYFGYSVRSFNELSCLKRAVRSTPPAALLMNTAYIRPPFTGAALLRELQQGRQHPLPVIFTSVHSDLETRIAAIHAGGHAYLVQPVATNDLVDELDKLTTCKTPELYRILIVEDEPSLAMHYARLLQAAGMTAVIATQASQLMQALADFKPDLIIMDLHLPGYSGLELAAMLRQQEAYVSIPIVFLSSETDMDIQMQALHLGADAFMTKPIAPQRLVSCITARIQRARTLRSFIMNDCLTGLLNHNSTLEQLDIELARARRQNAPLAFAMLDIDHFKSVNDTYGHLTGDRVLKSLARVLRQRLRATDIVGRYGGEEFAVILTQTSAAAARQVLDGIRADFARIRQPSPSGLTAPAGSSAGGCTGFDECPENPGFSVSFSAGIVTSLQWNDAAQLIEHADQALYAAKHAGRNQIRIGLTEPAL